MAEDQTEQRAVSTRLVAESELAVFDTAAFEHMWRVAKLMATSTLVPEHLVKDKDKNPLPAETAASNCFLVVNQSRKWKADPFAVAQETFVERGKIGYSGKLIAAVVQTRPEIDGRLLYELSGEGESRKIVVRGKLKGDPEVKEVSGTYAQWRTYDKQGGVNKSWSNGTDQMLRYRGAREWARAYIPEAVVGILSEDEVQQPEMRDITPPKPAAPTRAKDALDAFSGNTSTTSQAASARSPTAENASAAGEPQRQTSDTAPSTSEAAAGDAHASTSEHIDTHTGEVIEAPKAPDEALAAWVEEGKWLPWYKWLVAQMNGGMDNGTVISVMMRDRPCVEAVLEHGTYGAAFKRLLAARKIEVPDGFRGK